MMRIDMHPHFKSAIPTGDIDSGKNQENITRLVHSHISILGDQIIHIHFNPKQRLFASVEVRKFPYDGKTIGLPLIGVPQEIVHKGNIESFTRFFRSSHFILRKDSSGAYERVHVYPSRRGGTHAKIPFQPGLALGSIVHGEHLEKMEEYGKKTAAEASFEEQIKGVEQQIKVLDGKIESRKKTLGKNRTGSSSSTDQQDALIQIYTRQKEALATYANEHLSTVSNAPPAIPHFTNFQSSLHTPLDLSKCTTEVQPRGFDSMNYSSLYISMEDTLSDIQDKMTQSSSSGSVTGGGGWGPWKVSASSSWAHGAAERVLQTKQQGLAEGILVINAFVTTRHVRTLTETKYNKERLRQILDIMSDETTSSEKTKYGITADNKIYMLTEAVLGGSFTGLVTFIKEDEATRERKQQASESDRAVSAQAGVNYMGLGISGGSSYSSQSARQSEADLLKNSSNLNVTIEIFSQGALPQFTRETMQKEILKHLQLDPATFKLSEQDKTNAKAMTSSDAEKRTQAIYERQMQMENAQVALLNTCRGLVAEKQTYDVHTPSSIMGSYENFADQMVKDSGCGIPVGFNYTVLTKKEIEKILGEGESTS